MALIPVWTKFAGVDELGLQKGNVTRYHPPVVKAVGNQVYFVGADVTKYNPDGSIAWSNKWSNPNAIAVSADTRSDGSLVAIGFENGYSTPGWKANQTSFIAIFSPDGSVTREIPFLVTPFELNPVIPNPPKATQPLTISTNTDGSFYVSGWGEDYTHNGIGIAVNKYDANGNILWQSNLGVGAGERNRGAFVQSSAVSKDGSLYIVGNANGRIDGQSSLGKTDAFIVKYSPDGTKEWSRLFGSTGHEFATSVAVDNDGSIYVTGQTSGSNTFDGKAKPGGTNAPTAFVTKFSADGSKLWTTLVGSPDGAIVEGYSITPGNDGYLYITGTANVEDATAGGSDVFLSKLDTDGNLLSFQLFGSEYDDIGKWITTSDDGTIYISATGANDQYFISKISRNSIVNSELGNSEAPLSFRTTIILPPPKEGAGEFVVSVKVSAGTQSEENLAERTHVYWRITGIQQSDLANGYYLTGDGLVTNGKIDIKSSLVQDNIQESETFNISIYSDAFFSKQIGTASTVILGDIDIGSTVTTASKTTTLASTISRLILTGASNINGTGNALNNYITGNTGNNILDGGAGNDILAGGRGNDTYIVESIYDSIIENANEGNDTVRSSVDWTLDANLENLILTGSSNLTGTGNGLTNVITGNSGNNVLDGGVGNDTLIGGKGDDTYFVDSAREIVTEKANEGSDIVVSSISWTLGSNLENLTLTGSDAITGIGNTLKNIIIGNSGNNILDGLTGTDILTGGAGADTFRFSTKPAFGASTADRITDFNGIEGDTIQISKRVFGMASNATTSLTTIKSTAELTSALASTSTFVYDSTNGNLYWNQNGTKSGFGTGGIFAVLDNQSALSVDYVSSLIQLV
jgi:serralysin